MKNLIIFLPILFLALLETTIVPLNLTLIAVILWAALRSARQGLTVAFLAGLILDFLTGETLGLTSLFFLFLSFLVYLYKNRFQANRFAFLLPFTFFALIVIDFLEGLFTPSIRTVVKNGVNTILIVPLFSIIFNFLAKNSREEQLRLKI